ncbi:MAG: ATP-binding protein, partial [Bacilli bacterium]|nr:ATP-binding protein [Bacilli bacterium]
NEHRKKWYDLFNKKSTFNIFYCFIILVNIIMNLLPISDMVLINNEFQSVGGPAIVFFYISIVLTLIISTVTIIINRKKVKRKKIIPFYCLGPLITIAIIIVIIFPKYAVIHLFLTITCYLMYHTIENPDVRLITELKFAKEQAEKSNNAKSDFLSSMSHELRTPLNAIVGLSEVIIQSNDLDEIHEDGRDILNSSNSLLDLIDSILDLNKIDSNNMDIVNANYNPRVVFEDLIRISKIRIGEKNVELKHDFSSDIPQVLYGDKDKLKAIINNLLTNAIKYTDSGFVEFNADCIIKDDICNLRITVTDSGRGISDSQLETLFEKFNRREEDKDSDISGTGLGLALTKSLLDLMGGKINVNSEEGIGTTFTVTLNQKIIEEEVDNTPVEVL